MVPEDWGDKSIGTRILLAWNGSREARTAIGDALPFIGFAEWFKVLMVESFSEPERYGDDPGSEIAQYVARRNAQVAIEVERVTAPDTEDADTILSHASAVGADLLVVDAHSHAGLVRMLLGEDDLAPQIKVLVPILVSR